jgi:hypothetical protein
VVPVGSPPARCAGGGPPIAVGPAPLDCLGSLAQTTFRWALCSCKDVTLTTSLLTDAYDSTLGPYPPAARQVGGGVGANGNYLGPVSNEVDIGGALWSSGPGGVVTRSPTLVRQEVHVAGPLSAARDRLTIREDTYVGGNVSATSGMTIAKVLRLPSGAAITGNVTRASTVREPVSVPEPCDCAPSKLVPVIAIIDAQRASNDNASIGLDSGALASPSPSSEDVRLDLPCGRYYLTEIKKPGSSVTVYAHGRTAVFIDGDVVGQVISFVLAPTAELDVFIRGTIQAGGELVLGSPNYPALSRTYVAGTTPLQVQGEAGRLAGNLYAPHARVEVSSHFILYGGLFAGDFANTESVDIHYDRAVLDVGKGCLPPPPDVVTPDAGTLADAGAPPSDAGKVGVCASCRQCGNQACIDGVCGSCTTSSQCCAPLVCLGGTCKVSP